MRTLISHHSQPHFLFRHTHSSLSCLFTKPIFNIHRECLLIHQTTAPFSSVTVSCSAKSAASYNGWDDFRIWVDSDHLGESNHIKKLLISLGIYDKKYVFTCILGFVCALAISRVKVSSIVVFPATTVVFAVGFSFGFVNGGTNRGFNSIGGKTRVKEDYVGIYAQKLKNLVALFDGFDVKVGELKNVVKRAIDYERVELSDLEAYVDELELIGALTLKGRNVVEDCIGSVPGELKEVERNSNNKNSRKKKEIGNYRFDLFAVVGNFLKGKGTGSSTTRANAIRNDCGVDDLAQGAMQGSSVKRASDSVTGMVDDGRMNRLPDENRERKNILRRSKTETTRSHMHSGAFVDAGSGRFDYQSMRYVDNQEFSYNLSAHREIREWGFDDSVSSYSDLDTTNEHHVKESFLDTQQVFGNSIEADEFSGGKGAIDFRRFKATFNDERMNLEDELHTRKYQSEAKNDFGSFSSSAISDDIEFDKCLRKATDLLKQTKECLKVQNDDITAEEMLHESTRLLSQAIAMKPMSLLAIGQLGNTYLLHGELKLRMSRSLRSLLSRREGEDLNPERWNSLLASLDETRPSKDRIAAHLVETCEECEMLLVQAGRKYKTALSIDGSDVRALYNWGLALFFRAQLIADIGPEAALDADKLFLAAIDKFDAMMSRSNVYAPDALFRWGVALQQRSRLRQNNRRDKLKLLQQAKRLYEDALGMGSKNLQVREALSSCMSELDFSDT